MRMNILKQTQTHCKKYSSIIMLESGDEKRTKAQRQSRGNPKDNQLSLDNSADLDDFLS